MASLCLLAVAAAIIAPIGGESIDRVVVNGLVNLVFVIGLYAFVGTSGLFSFGHMSFAAVGAYTASLVTIPEGTKEVLFSSPPTGLLLHAHLGAVAATGLAGLVAAAVALVLAVPLMRLSGFASTLATFSLLIIVNVVASNWQTVTNGASGLYAVPTTTTWVSALAWVIVAIVLTYAFQQSRWGLRLRASREDEVAARASGISVFSERRVAWVLSAFLTGIAGALYVQFIGSFTPDVFFLNLTFLIIAMLVVGGLTSLAGAVVGGVAITTISELLSRLENGITIGPVHTPSRPGLQEVVLAAILLVILARRPKGLMNGREITWPVRKTHRITPVAAGE
ncbi:MAG: inner-rane translocator [Conexibacter sp.]|nr:inner-rane translocator [Conexibacter sp.]